MAGVTLLSLVLAAAGPGPVTLDLDERSPALLIVAIPPGANPEIPATDHLRAADRAFRASTGLDLRAPEQAGVDGERLSRCDGPGRLACWLGAVQERPLAAILVVTALPVGRGRDRVVLTLLYPARAAHCEREPSLGAREATEALEDCIWVGAARTVPTVVTAAELPGYYAAQVQGALSPLLEDMGQLSPFGRIELSSTTPDVEVRVDGRLYGVIAAGTSLLGEVRPGRRVLDFTRPGYAALRRPVQVRPGQTATAAVSLLSLDPPPALTGDEALLYAGGAAAAAGVGLGIYALVRALEVDSHCLVATPEAPCTGLGAPTFGLTTDTLPTADRDRVNPSGVPIGAVAAGLGFAGLGWLTGALVFEEDEGVPWWGILTGLAAGALGAAVAVAAAPR